MVCEKGPVTATFEMLSAVDPELVSDTDLGELDVSTICEPKLTVEGAAVALLPTPVSVAVTEPVADPV